MAASQPHRAEPPQPPSRGGLSPRILLSLVVIVVIVGGVALLTTGVPATGPACRHPGSRLLQVQRLARLAARPEPPLSLRNYKGERVNIDQYKGKAVLVTFLYTKCPDVCPMIASNLGVALNKMGSAKASKVQVIAVSVDPRGDTPAAVATFLQRHGMAGRMQYLIGSANELGHVWKAWGVGAEQDAEQPQLVNHSGLVYGISAQGKVTTLYAASFTPQEIVHDVPLLASS